MILVWYVSGRLYNRRSFLYSIIANAPDSFSKPSLDHEFQIRILQDKAPKFAADLLQLTFEYPFLDQHQ